MYQSAFKLLLIWTTNAHVVYAIAPQTFTSVQNPYADIECKQRTCERNEVSRHVHGHKNAAPRIRTRLKGRHCDIFVPSFVVQRTRITVSLYAALSIGAEVMVTKLTDHTVSNVDPPFKRKMGVLQTCLFLTNGPWCCFTVFQGWLHNISAF